MHQHMIRQLRNGGVIRFETKNDKNRADMQTKHGIRFEMKEDAEKGTVEAIFCRFNVKDHDGDVTLPDAFTNGAEVLISAYGHASWRGEKPVGKGKIRVEKEYAVLEGTFWLDTVEGRETFAVVKNAGSLMEWSYGFFVTKTGEVTEAMRQAGVYRVLEGVEVYEICPVMLGAGVDTETIGVKGQKPVDTTKPAATAEEVETQSAILKELARFERTRARLVG